MSHELKITFPAEEAKKKFAEWMCDGGGEQQYMDAMEDSETPNLKLGYHGKENEEFPPNDKRRYGKFLCDDTIRVQACED